MPAIDSSLLRFFKVKPDNPNSGWKDVFGYVYVYDNREVFVHSSLFPGEKIFFLDDASREDITLIADGENAHTSNHYAPVEWVISKHTDPFLIDVVKWVAERALEACTILDDTSNTYQFKSSESN